MARFIQHSVFAGLLLLAVSSEVRADDALPGAQMPGVENENRARINYMLNCQGCHGASGTGTIDGAVPTMKDFLANFLAISGGREFLIRVPGSANAALPDSELAEVLNWMLSTMSAAQMPDDFKPYTASEVARLRKQPLQDVEGVREKLISLLDEPRG